MKYMRIVNNMAVEAFAPPNGLNIADCFHPDIASQFMLVPGDVTYGWTRDEDGVWTAPSPPPAPIPTKPVTVDQFRAKLLFAEKVKWDNPDDLAAAQKATVNTVKADFAVTGTLDFLLESTVEEIDALETVGVLGKDRAAQIIAELTA
jgi:hypothetical protein